MLATREHQVESPIAELREAHEAAAFHSADVLRLKSELDAHAATQADVSRHEAEEASPCYWPSLRANSRRRIPRAMDKLSTLHERHTTTEVLREENRALECRAASADELRETVVRLDAEVNAAHAEREAWCAIFFSLSVCSTLWCELY